MDGTRILCGFSAGWLMLDVFRLKKECIGLCFKYGKATVFGDRFLCGGFGFIAEDSGRLALRLDFWACRSGCGWFRKGGRFCRGRNGFCALELLVGLGGSLVYNFPAF